MESLHFTLLVRLDIDIFLADLETLQEFFCSLQLFLQLAGRAGRGEKPGKVLVQTYCPAHPEIRHLVDGCYEDFLKQESQTKF